MNLKFYTAIQNNSGGYFIENDDVESYVIIQAESYEQAEDKLMDITKNYSEYCYCCGKRWEVYWDEDSGDDTPMIYNKSVYETKAGLFREGAIIYYLDGRKEKVILPK